MKKIFTLGALLAVAFTITGCKVKYKKCRGDKCEEVIIEKVQDMKSLNSVNSGIFHQVYAVFTEEGDSIINQSSEDMTVKYITSNLSLAGNSMMALEVVNANESVIAYQEFDAVLSNKTLRFANPADVDNWLSSYATNTNYNYNIIVATEYQVTGAPGQVALIKGGLNYLGNEQASSRKSWVIEAQVDEGDDDSGFTPPVGVRPGTGVCRPGQPCRSEP